MVAAMRVMVAVLTMVAISELAMAVNYDVGGPAGSWDLTTNYTQWISGKKFRLGDTLTFKYVSSLHDVLEVSSSAYASCTTSNPISTGTGGNTVIALSSTGKKYFICGTPSHCAQGMKVEIDIASSSSSPPPRRSPSAPSPRSPAAPPPESSSSGSALPPSVPTISLPQAPNGAANGAGVSVKVALGLSSGVMLMLLAL